MFSLSRQTLLTSLLLLGVFPAAAQKEPPELNFLFPIGARAGSTNELEVGGKFAPWPVQFWASDDRIQIDPAEKEGRATVVVPADMPAGEYWIRAFNDQGASRPVLFQVGEIAEAPEEEPNNARETAQVLESLPVVVNGRLQRGEDVDLFLISLRSGETLVASLAAYRLDAPVDAVLELWRSNGEKVGFNHDWFHLDPLLAYTADRDDTYLLSVAGFAHPPRADVRFAGDDRAVYRLLLTKEAFALGAFPPVAREGTLASILMDGWNLAGAGWSRIAQPLEVEAKAGDSIPLRLPNGVSVARLDVISDPVRVEQEPNDGADQAQALEVPSSVAGRIDQKGDHDFFTYQFHGKQTYAFRVQSRQRKHGLDPVVRILDRTGKELKRNDDTKGLGGDVQFDWKPPGDGWFLLEISDLFGNASSTHQYSLSAREQESSWLAFTEENSVRLVPGQSHSLKVRVEAEAGWDGELAIFIDQLPQGVISTIGSAGSKGGEVSVELQADEKAEAAQARARVLGVTVSGRPGNSRVIPVRIKGQSTEAGELYLNELDHVWVTVVKKAVEEEEKK